MKDAKISRPSLYNDHFYLAVTSVDTLKVFQWLVRGHPVRPSVWPATKIQQ